MPFQSTPPHGGRLVMHDDDAAVPKGTFQSTPPHGGRPATRRDRRQSRAYFVSIHAPARGATPADAGRSGMNVIRTCFNPRPRTGGDLRWPSQPVTGGRPRPVSIHAPARGATRPARPDSPDTFCSVRRFQSTPPHGGRLGPFIGCNRLYLEHRFQSTPPHGGRPGVASRTRCTGLDYGFNPRPRTGGDPASMVPGTATDSLTFQSTPPHGGRLRSRMNDAQPVRPTFQSTPPHGGRLSMAM